MSRIVFNVTLIVGLVLFLPLRAAAQVPAPEAFFGFKMGADGKLADWPAITKYFETVAAASPASNWWTSARRPRAAA